MSSSSARESCSALRVNSIEVIIMDGVGSDRALFREGQEALAKVERLSRSDVEVGDASKLVNELASVVRLRNVRVDHTSLGVSPRHAGEDGSLQWRVVLRRIPSLRVRDTCFVWDVFECLIFGQLDKYQEQPQLLDPSLEGMITPVMERARAILAAWFEEVAGSSGTSTDAAFPFQRFDHPVLHELMRYMYLLCKTRGSKVVVRFLPHAVADLEPCLLALLSQDRSASHSWHTRYVLFLWMSILALIPFDLRTVDSSLSVVVAAATAEAQEPELLLHSGTAQTTDRSTEPGLIEAIVRVGKEFLGDSSAVRDAAAICLSRLLTRPDMERAHLRSFFGWAVRTLETATIHAAHGQSIILSTGVLTTVVHMSKHGNRQALLDGGLATVMQRVVALADTPDERGGGGETSLLRSSVVLRKLTVKLAQRTGLSHLPPRIVSWRYQRGQRSLLDNLRAAGVPNTGEKHKDDSEREDEERGRDGREDGASARLAGDLKALGGGEVEEDDDAIEVPEEVEEIVDVLLTGLRDRDTVVRWSAAKGVGRITSRLPRELADDVVEAVLELLVPEEGEDAWHGGCLALAELARRGLLLPERLPATVPRVTHALQFDLRRGATSVGVNVRDSACYVCWAFARAYHPSIMRPFVEELARGMLITALFDREVNCRRAASAAFQESVGRQGAENFPHGIEILTAADYFTLGNRSHAYLTVAPKVASYDASLLPHFVEHLWKSKLRHWDASVRRLAAEALAALVPLDPKLLVRDVLAELVGRTTVPDVLERHGAIEGIACLLPALAQQPSFDAELVTGQLLKDVRMLVPRSEKARVYRGRSSERIRQAMCRLIASSARSGLTFARKGFFRLLQTLEECLKHPHDSVQQAATDAFRALCEHCLPEVDAEVRERLALLPARVACDDENPAARRGGALAVGQLPRCLFETTPAAAATGEDREPQAEQSGGGNVKKKNKKTSTLASMAGVPTTELTEEDCHAARSGSQTRSRVVAALVQASRPETVVSRRDVETRRNAVQSIACLVEELGVQVGSGHDSEDAALTPEECHALWGALLRGTHDYSTDSRGDVGSWVRRAAVEALEKVTRVLLALPLRVALNGPVYGAVEFSPPPIATLQKGNEAAARMEPPLSEAEQNVRRVQLVAKSHWPLPGLAVWNAIHKRGTLRRTRGLGALWVVQFGDDDGATESASEQERVVPARECQIQAAPCDTWQGSLWHQVVTAAWTHSAGSSSSPILPAHEERRAWFSSDQVNAVHLRMQSAQESAPGVAAGTASSMFTREMATRFLQCSMRLLGEHLDVVRGATGDVLSRLLHDAAFPLDTTGVGEVALLRAILTPSGRIIADSVSDAETAMLRDARAQRRRGSAGEKGSGHAEENDDDNVDWSELERSADTKGGEGRSVTMSKWRAQLLATVPEGVNYAVPSQVFPRVAAILALPNYTLETTEGLVLSVGGLTEGVVKASSAALVKWARDEVRDGRYHTVARLAAALLRLLRGRVRKPVEGRETTPEQRTSGEGEAQSETAKPQCGDESRAPPAAAGAGAGGESARSTFKGERSVGVGYRVETRLVLPVLRTLEALLSQGSFVSLAEERVNATLSVRTTLADILGEDVESWDGPGGIWPRMAIPLVRYRVMRSQDPVRLVAAINVFLSMMSMPNPVGSAAMTSVLDLMGHLFPTVRKSAAEKLYVKLLELQDDFSHRSAEDFDRALDILTETVWQGEDDPALDARDRLYEPLGLSIPPFRMGARLESGGRHGWPVEDGSGRFAHDENASYMALVREVGY